MEQIVKEEVLTVPVEIEDKKPEFVYVKVLFEHELLEGQQLMEAEVLPMNNDRIYTYAILNLYYEYSIIDWQTFN